MNLQYRKLFSIQLWHDFYTGQLDPLPSDVFGDSYDIGKHIGIVPSLKCTEELRNYNMLMKPTRTGWDVRVKASPVDDSDPNTAYNTFIPVEAGTILRFFLVLKDPFLVNFSNLPLGHISSSFLYVNNLSNNQGHALFLSKPLEAYTAGNDYPLGSLVSHSDNLVYEAMRPVETAPAGDPPANDWESYPGTQYLSSSDYFPKQKPFRSYLYAAANPGDTLIFDLVDALGNSAFSAALDVPQEHSPGEDFVFHLNFGSIPAGFYNLTVNGEDQGSFVMFDPLLYPRVFGLVEICLDETNVPAAYNLLTLNGGETEITDNTYTLRFKNRWTLWRYHFAEAHGFDNATLNANAFDLIDANQFVSQRPLPLALTSAIQDVGVENSLPCPGYESIKPELDVNQRLTAIYSDIYL